MLETKTNADPGMAEVEDAKKILYGLKGQQSNISIQFDTPLINYYSIAK